MAIHSSILAWKIPQTEEPGGLQSMGPQRVGHHLVTEQYKHNTRVEEGSVGEGSWWLVWGGQSLVTPASCHPDLGWPQPAAACSEAQIPSQRLRPGHLGESAGSYPLDPVVSDKGPGPSALQKRISTKMEGSVASIVFIKRGNSTALLDRHMSGPLGE